MTRFDTHHGFTNRAGQSSYAHLARLLVPHRQAHHTIVDLGCGTGEFFDALPTHAGRMIGIDPDTHALATAQQRHAQRPHIEWRVGTFAQTGLAPASVDLVCAHSALMMAPNLPTACAELARILRPGGLVAAVLPLSWRDEYSAEYGYYFGTMNAIAYAMHAQGILRPQAARNIACDEPDRLGPHFSPSTGFIDFHAETFSIDFSGSVTEVLAVIAQMYMFAALPEPAQSIALAAARAYLAAHVAEHVADDGTVPFRRPLWSFTARRLPR